MEMMIPLIAYYVHAMVELKNVLYSLPPIPTIMSVHYPLLPTLHLILTKCGLGMLCISAVLLML